MKTIALSMIFSLAVIVCEGQTLFAPAFVKLGDFKAANSLTNGHCNHRRIVNRSVPLAGASYNPGKGASRAIVHPQYSPSGPDRKPKNNIWIVDTGGGLTSVESLGQAQRNSSDGLNGPGMHDSVHDIRGEDDGPLVWDAPRGYFGVAGSANPGGDDI
jgi:hypothetical protein